VVAHLVRLKLALLANVFRRSRAQTIGAVVGIVYFSVLVLGLTLIVATLRTSIEVATVALPLAGAVGIVLWTVVPLFSFGSDPTLDPSRFALYAVPPRSLATGLIAAALVGLPALASAVLGLGVVMAWSQTPASTLVAVVGTVVGILTAITLSRWVSALAAAATSSRRGRDTLVVVGLVVLVLVGPVVWVAANAHDIQRLAVSASKVVAWTPLGWAWAAPGDVAAGRPFVGAVRLVLAVVFLLAVGMLWSRAVRRQVENPRAVPRRDSTPSAPGDLGLFARAPDHPAGAVAARVLTYWRRDPRYQISLLMTPVFPLALLIPWASADVAWTPLLMGPLLAFLLGWSEHNAIAYESEAFSLHVAAGTRGLDDRLGRVVPGLLLAGVLVPVYGLVGVWLGDRWDLLPLVLGVSATVLGAGVAVSSVLNIVLPYPVAQPGESPFSAPPGAAGITILAQTLASAATFALSAPLLLLAWLAYASDSATWLVWVTGGVGVVLGPVVAGIGVRYGARLYDRRAPDLLADLQRV
jgi:ABC-2 type transport system permease protein